MEVPHLVPLVGGESSRRLGDKGLHLYILRPHERAGDAAQVDPLIALDDMVCLNTGGRLRLRSGQPRLCHQRRMELGWQFLPPLLRSAQDAQAGRPA